MQKGLAAVKQGEISVEDFRDHFRQAKEDAPKSLEVSKIAYDFDRWRIVVLNNAVLLWKAPFLNRADSLLQLLILEYPQEIILISGLHDTLRQRSIREIEKKYYTLVNNAQSSENTLKDADSLLDSAYIAFGMDVRITELQSDLAKRRNDLVAQAQLALEAKRQRNLARNQLLAAIQVKEPANMTLKAYSSTRETQDKIVLKNSKILQSVRVFLNETEMSSQAIGKETFKRGTVTIPPAAQKVIVTVRAIDKEGNEVSKDLTFKIDRMPLRHKASENLSTEKVKNVIKKFDFYSTDKYDWAKEWSNPNGKGIDNDFVLQQSGQVVLDRATGLIWQQGGSLRMNYEKAQEYIADLDRRKVGGFDDWRLPTLEEAMALMEPQKQSNGLYIEPIFDKTQPWIWTADKESASRAWSVHFGNGHCFSDIDVGFHVRAVR